MIQMLDVVAVRVAVDGSDENGLLVLRDRILVAVLVCLERAMYLNDVGCWHLEAGFGSCAAPPRTFATLEVALRWIAGRLKLDVEAAIAPALASFRPSGPCR